MPLFGIEPGGAVVDAQIVAGVFAVNLFAGVWGFALGFLLRNPALAVGLFAVRTLLLETYGAKAFPDVGKYVFTSAMGSLYKDPGPLSIAVLPAVCVGLAWSGWRWSVPPRRSGRGTSEAALQRRQGSSARDGVPRSPGSHAGALR